MTSLFSTHITLKLILTHEYQRGTGNIHSLDKSLTTQRLSVIYIFMSVKTIRGHWRVDPILSGKSLGSKLETKIPTDLRSDAKIRTEIKGTILNLS